MRKTVFGALALTFAIGASSAALAQAAAPQSLVSACGAGDCSAQVEAYVADLTASGADVDQALFALVTAVQQSDAPAPRLSAVARLAAARAVDPTARLSLTQVADAAIATNSITATAASAS